MATTIRADYTSALTQSAGIGRCTRELFTALRSILPADVRVELFANKNAVIGGKRTPFPVRHLPLTERQGIIFWQRVRVPWPIEPFVGKADLWHFPDYLLLPTLSGRTILTIHDLSFLVMPQFAHRKLQQFLAKAVPRSARRANHLIADSESTRRDIVRIWGIPEERVSVVYCGVDRRFRPINDNEALDRVRDKYALPERFFLFVGKIEPRKNLTGLIRIFTRLVEAHPGLRQHLVIAGGKGWDYEPVFAAAAASPARARIHFVGFVDDADLPALLSCADALVYPSHYEGFGLPPLEAMACGTPVVVSDRASLPEVVGDAGYVLPLEEEQSWLTALLALAESEETRAAYARRGLTRAKRFTWEAAAGALLMVYWSVLGGLGG